MNFVEIIGYVGSALVAISLTMKNIFYLRRINLLGAAAFAIYGLLVGAMPVLFLNSFITLVDIYYIWDEKRKKEYFTLLTVSNCDAGLLKKFFDFYKSDIKKYFPDFNKESLADSKSFFILRNLIPVGLLVYEEITDTEINILVDYAIPDYRDLKTARFVYFAQSNHFDKKGYKTLIAASTIDVHKKYLKKIGFTKDKEGVYVKILDKSN